MQALPVFLSVVVVVRNQANDVPAILNEITARVSSLVTDYELVVVDNASTDHSVSVLKSLAAEGGLANLQIYALTKEVDLDTASWVGVESALGDFVAIFNPLTDSISFLSEMLNKAVSGMDVVFAVNRRKARQSLTYQAANGVFNILYKWFNDVNLSAEAPDYRLLSRRVVNFILQHSQPVVTYRHLPATGGFARANLTYDAQLKSSPQKRLWNSVDRGARLLVSTTRGPMRIVTTLSLFGAVSNLVYSVYVIAIAFFKTDVAPGWVTMSLQQSGMFFLISLVLLVLGEYILQMVSLSNEAPLYHVAQEFTSARMTRLERLNIEEVKKGNIHDYNDQRIN